MEQKDTYLIYLKENFRNRICNNAALLPIEISLFVLTWYKLGWFMIAFTFPVWFILFLVHYFTLTEAFEYWKRYKHYLGSRSLTEQ